MVIDMEDETELMKRKAQVFLDRETPVHISDKTDSWHNGFIKEISADFLVLDEFKFGEQVIFFSEIVKFESYTKEVKDDSKMER